MIKVAPVLVLVLLAALQVVAAINSPIVLDIGEYEDTAKKMVRSYSGETGEEPGADTMPEHPYSAEEETHDNSTSFVLTMPYLPVIVYFGGVSMSFIDISIEGLDLVELPAILDLLPVQGVITIPVSSPSLVFNAGSYVAGGKLINLPFVGTGSSSAQIGLTNLDIVLSYTVKNAVNVCPKAGSVKFEMTLDRLNVNFEDLNPGQDSGEVINAMLNSVTDDITKWINILLNEEPGKELLERLIGAVISSQLPFNCNGRHSSGDGQAEYVESGLVGDGDSSDKEETLAEITQVLEKLILRLSGRMEVLEDVEALFELVGDLLPEMNLGHPDFTQHNFVK